MSYLKIPRFTGRKTMFFLIFAIAVLFLFVQMSIVMAADGEPKTPAPVKESIKPEKWSALTDMVSFVYDFNDLENDIDHLNMYIEGPPPYDGPGNRIEWRFFANMSYPWDGWIAENRTVAQDMGVTPSYNRYLERWIITIDTTEVWNKTNPWGQPINSSVWPAGLYNFVIEVVDAEGNKWGDAVSQPDYCRYVYSFHSIQPVIDSAVANSTVHVYNGTFSDRLVINKTLNLVGSGNTIVQPVDTPQAGVYDVELDPGSSGAVIKNFIFDFNGDDDTRSGTGIAVSDLNQPAVSNVSILNNIIYTGDGGGVGGTAIQTGKNSDVSGLLIQGNVFYGDVSGMGEGVYVNPFSGSGVVEIYKNKFYGNLYSGVSVEASNVIVSQNVINSNASKGVYGVRFIDTAGGQTYSGVKIVSNDIRNFQNGIMVGTSSDVGSSLSAVIGSNTVTSNDVGIWVRYGADLSGSVHKNNIFGNADYGLNNVVGSTVVNASLNWWGNSTGPYHPLNNPTGSGDNVSDNVYISNWLNFEWINKVWIHPSYDSSTPGWGIDHFNKIKDGIDAVYSGGVVKPKPATYEEVFTVDKPLTIESAYGEPSLTVITDLHSNYSELQKTKGQTIQIASKDVTIKGVKVVRNNYGTGDHVSAIGNNGCPGVSNITVVDCEITSIYKGLYFDVVKDLDVSSNEVISGNQISIYMRSVDGFLVYFNGMTSSEWNGLVMKKCQNGKVLNNNVYQKFEVGIKLENCENIVLDSGKVYNNTKGFMVVDSVDIDIVNFRIKYNDVGVNIVGDSKVDIRNNQFLHNTYFLYNAVYASDGYYYGSIQKAVETAGVGSEVKVYYGHYKENVYINKSVNLEGHLGPDDIVVDGGNDTAAIYIGENVDVADVEISHLTITGGFNCVKTGFNRNVSGLMIRKCKIQDPHGGYAVYIDPHQYSDYPPIRNGTLLFSKPVVLYDNFIRGGVYYRYKPFEMYGLPVNMQLHIVHNDIDKVFLNSSISVKVENNTIQSIGVRGTYDLYIGNNEINNIPGDLRYGVYLWSIRGEKPVEKITVAHNSVIGYSAMQVENGVSGIGVLIAGCKDVTLVSNVFMANTNGIWVTENYSNLYNQSCIGDTLNIRINGNDIENGQTGIKLLENVNKTIIENNVINSNGEGIWLHGSGHNVICNNSIMNGYYGVKIDGKSSGNIIYNNYFTGNSFSAYDIFSHNIWNVSLINGTNIAGGPKIGGNYWDDYTGEDLDGDFIGDTDLPFNCSGGIVNGGDYHPLISSDTTPPMVHVIYPNGGENLNRTVTILWEADDDIDEDLLIDLFYSNNGGDNWYLISPNEENDGEYIWNITNMPEGSQYKIKVVAEDNAGNKGEDTSDKVFNIIGKNYGGPNVTILKPKMGYLYFFDVPKARLFPNNVFIIGQITIRAEVITPLGVDRVEFQIDDDVIATQQTGKNNIYSLEWDETVFFGHEITVTAYDLNGNHDSDSIFVTIFNFNIIP